MCKLLLAAAFVVASASVQAQTIDVGSLLSANGISVGKSGQPQAGGQAQDGMFPNAGSQGGQSAAGQGQGKSQRQAGRARQPRESAQETRARTIAAKYGISW
ncbi:hypothetical protein [Bradyrhizobium sp. SZCCHNPS1003]|uniref:hypothetical protein n=1 Tax=Bradyrhizobium sp. SZCCHNPS1003 TaxID=3057330 RepID=UPI0028F07E8D|nr:hypothetical protein [Bradyrhizobium sp. SZCCHNPS1003]